MTGILSGKFKLSLAAKHIDARQPEAAIHIFYAVGDPGEISLTEKQAAKLMGITLPAFQALKDADVLPDELTIHSVSSWIEERINNSRRIRRNAFVDFLAAEYKNGKEKWNRKALEEQFSRKAVSDAIGEEILVINLQGELLLALNVEGTVMHRLKQLVDEKDVRLSDLQDAAALKKFVA